MGSLRGRQSKTCNCGADTDRADLNVEFEILLSGAFYDRLVAQADRFHTDSFSVLLTLIRAGLPRLEQS